VRIIKSLHENKKRNAYCVCMCVCMCMYVCVCVCVCMCVCVCVCNKKTQKMQKILKTNGIRSC